MNPKQIVLVVLIATTISSTIKAQQNNVEDKKHSLILPHDYQDKGKSYPLLVCYKNRDMDSLLSLYAKNTQTIILQFCSTSDSGSKSEPLKASIQKTMHGYAVAREKIYLLGVDQNINKTAEIREAMGYYFAATAYITSNRDRYTQLSDSLKPHSNTKLYFFDSIDYNALETVHKLFLQNYLWAYEVKKISDDATRFNMSGNKKEKYNWQLSLGYGMWYFYGSAKSKEKTFLDFPKNMGAWNFSCARFFAEHLSISANLGFLIKKITPPRPDVYSIINGSEVEIEGGGIFLMPVSIGLDYLFLKRGFRPFAGFGVGMVPAKYRYIEASGNLTDGIHKNEYKFTSSAPFVELSSGFFYRTGKNVQLGLNCDYLQSKDFSENIGGYKAYNGFKISVLFSVVF